MARTSFLLAGLSFACLASGLTESCKAQYWGPSYRSSTVTEANARGIGALIRDQGEANLLNAQAATETEVARSQYIQNKVDGLQAYYDRKRIREEYYAEKKKEKAEALDRFVARRGSVPKLDTEDFDPTTGAISWPSLLTADEFAEYREPYEAIFAELFENGRLPSEKFMEAQKISRQWRKRLADDRKKYNLEQVRMSIRFILALDKQLSKT